MRPNALSVVPILFCLFVRPSATMDWGNLMRRPQPDDASSPEQQEPPGGVCFGDFDFDCGIGERRSRCISAFWHCDNVFDCTTGMDELGCHYLHRCQTGDFLCRNGDCVLAQLRCNGIPDCIDGSDERGCGWPSGTNTVMAWQKKKSLPLPNEESSKPLNASAINVDQKLVALLSKHGHQDQMEGAHHNYKGWFMVLSILLALLVAGQLVVLVKVCARKSLVEGNRQQQKGQVPKLYCSEKLCTTKMSGRSRGERTTRVRFVSSSSTANTASIIPINGKNECAAIIIEEEEGEEEQEMKEQKAENDGQDEEKQLLKKL